MKRWIVLILLLCGNFAFGQKITHFSISGKVFDCKTNEPIPSIKVKFISGDGMVFHTFSNYKGEYHIDSSFTRPSIACLLTFVTGLTEFCVPGSDKRKIIFYSSDTVIRIIEDCPLDINAETTAFPVIYFQKNSSAIDAENLKQIKIMAQLLKDYPNLVVFVEGTNDKSEGKRDNLERAEKVTELLVKEGVDINRLMSTGLLGESLNPERFIPTVSFRIFKKDYVPK